MKFQRQSYQDLSPSQLQFKDQQKSLLTKVNTHTILANSSLLQSIKQYDKSINKTQKHSKGLTKAHVSLLTAPTSKIGTETNKNIKKVITNHRHITHQINSANNLQRCLSKDKSQLDNKYTTIDNQSYKIKMIDKHQLVTTRVQRPFSTISNIRLESYSQLYKIQNHKFGKIKNQFQQFEPIQRKLKIFREKIKLGQNNNKKRQQNDKQHREIERILQILQQQKYMNKGSDVQKDQINSTKEEINTLGYDNECINEEGKHIAKGYKRKNRGINSKSIYNDKQKSDVKLQYQRSLIKLAQKQKIQLNLDYLNRKPLLKGRYQIIQKIGKGLSGQVFKAKDILSDRLVAVKVIINNFKEEEYSFYKQNNHKNIVQYYNNFVENNIRYLILEYFPYTLQSYARHHKLNELQIKAIFKNIVCGLSFLHAMSIAHRDIKLNNIVVSQKLETFKFIDFGLCIQITQCHQQMTKECCGTVKYMPPQILQKRQYNPRKADIWSLGVVLYYLLHNRFPYNGRSEFDMLQKINKTKLFIDVGLDSNLKQLLRGMLEKRPTQRLTIIQIIDSKWLH